MPSIKLVTLASLAAVGAGQMTQSYVPPIIPGTGYGCDNPCNGGDRNYHITVEPRKFTVPGSKTIDAAYPGIPLSEREDLSYYTRSFVGAPHPDPQHYCANMTGDGGVFGPCLSVAPGETMFIKVENKLGDAMSLFSNITDWAHSWDAPMPTRKSFYEAMVHDNVGDLTRGHLPADTAEAIAGMPYFYEGETELNMPGADTGTRADGKTNGFDSTDLHLHGMEVVPHLFYPMGTSDPNSDYITIDPDAHQHLVDPATGERMAQTTQCHCYAFTVADTNAIGTFMYHVHRHGATAYQTWSGMGGVLNVVPPASTPKAAGVDEWSVPKAEAAEVKQQQQQQQQQPQSSRRLRGTKEQEKQEEQLEQLRQEEQSEIQRQHEHNFDSWCADRGIGNDKFFFLWDPPLQNTTVGTATAPVMATQGYSEAGGNKNMELTPWLVNDDYQPRFDFEAGKYERIRIACFSAGNTCAFEIRKALKGASAATGNYTRHPFLHVGSDAFAFDRAFAVDQFHMGPGQREDILVKLDQAGDDGREYEYTVWSAFAANGGWQPRLAPGPVRKVTGPGGKTGEVYEQLVATFAVTAGAPSASAAAVAIDEAKLFVPYDYAAPLAGGIPPGRPQAKDIRPEEITRTRFATFDKGAKKGVVPYEQWEVSQKMYQLDRTSNVVAAKGDGTAVEEWIIFNTSPMVHPFHIHVNPFQVVDVVTSDATTNSGRWMAGEGNAPGQHFHASTVTNQGVSVDPYTGARSSQMRWRDTIFVPPGGSVRLWMRFDARNPLRENADGGVDPGSVFTGKTVYHCHFLTHEDAGMIENFMLTDGSDAAAALESDLDYDGHVRDGVECGPEGCKAANANLEPHMDIARPENPGSAAPPTPSATSVLRGKGKGAKNV